MYGIYLETDILILCIFGGVVDYVIVVFAELMEIAVFLSDLTLVVHTYTK